MWNRIVERIAGEARRGGRLRRFLLDAALVAAFALTTSVLSR